MVRDEDFPCLFGFGGLLLQDNHPLVRDEVADTDVEDFPNATCGPIEDLRDKSVFLGEMGLDEVPFLLREDLGLPRPVDLERNSHWWVPVERPKYTTSLHRASRSERGWLNFPENFNLQSQSGRDFFPGQRV